MGLIPQDVLVSDSICIRMHDVSKQSIGVSVCMGAEVSKGAKSWKQIQIKSQDHCRNNGTSGPDIWSQRTFRSFPASSHLAGKLAK